MKNIITKIIKNNEFNNSVGMTENTISYLKTEEQTPSNLNNRETRPNRNEGSQRPVGYINKMVNILTNRARKRGETDI